MVAATALFLALSLAHRAVADAGLVELNQDQVEQVEDWTESLANQLHDLSLAVRNRDAVALASHFSENLSATP